MSTLKKHFDFKILYKDITYRDLKIGDRVWSNKYGLGKIIEICNGWGCIEVDFDNTKWKGCCYYRDKGYPYDLLGDRIIEKRTELFILVKKENRMLKERKEEMRRWLENPNEPKLWVKCKFNSNNKWFKIEFEDCGWSKDCHYIVDDEQAELRMLQIDEPNTNFEYYNEKIGRWLETVLPEWNINTKYRVKQEVKYPIFKVGNKGTDKEFIVEFSSLTIGKVVFAMPNSCYSIGHTFVGELNHTDDCWKDINYNLERGLYDKQPIICWDNNMETAKIIGFYDAKNDGVFNIEGYRDGFEYENYVPYPHPDDEFITEMYKKLDVEFRKKVKGK